MPGVEMNDITENGQRPSTARSLVNFFTPKSVAIVGLSDRLKIPTIPSLLAHPELKVFLVHPTKEYLFEKKTFPTLQAIGEPIDIVLSLVNAERAAEIVQQARELGAAGVIVIAAGFKEAGEAGAGLETNLRKAAGDALPFLGPNCFGFCDFVRGVDLSLGTAAPPGTKSGSIALITHTGGMIPATVAAGLDRNLGFSYTISTGNECDVDMVDCLEFLIDDPATRGIALIIESIRRPGAFFAAARRAAEAGKPIVALKLGRSARSVALAKSHTGALAGDAWVYDAAFRQHGIFPARDLADMLDQLSGFEQIPPARWASAKSIAVITPTGGGASLASDVFADFDLQLPEMESIRGDVQAVVPTCSVLNPIDTTAFIFSQPQIGDALAKAYASSDEVGTIVLQWHLQDQLLRTAQRFAEGLMEECAQHGKAFVLSAAEDSHIEPVAKELACKGAMLARGPVAAARALRAMADFTDMQTRVRRPSPGSTGERLPRPSAEDLCPSDAGLMLNFRSTMELLKTSGFEVAPYSVVSPEAITIAPPPGDRFVVKLADIPHRTELGAIRLGVAASDISAAVDEMRSLARARQLPEAVAIQAQLPVDGEAFIGLNADGGLGPMVICGVGGIFVEVLKKTCGLIAPFTTQDAAYALQALDETGVFRGLRGSAPWDRAALIQSMMAAARLLCLGQEWISTLDVNPLVFSNGRFVAVDGLCLVR